MQGFMERLTGALRRLLYGRNGMDALAIALFVLGLVLFVVAQFVWSAALYALYFALVALAFFRILSRNVAKRRQENAKFLALMRKPAAWVRLRRRMFAERGQYAYFKCPQCKQMLRVPRGAGKIAATCKSCGHRVTKSV